MTIIWYVQNTDKEAGKRVKITSSQPWGQKKGWHCHLKRDNSMVQIELV